MMLSLMFKTRLRMDSVAFIFIQIIRKNVPLLLNSNLCLYKFRHTKCRRPWRRHVGNETHWTSAGNTLFHKTISDNHWLKNVRDAIGEPTHSWTWPICFRILKHEGKDCDKVWVRQTNQNSNDMTKQFSIPKIENLK